MAQLVISRWEDGPEQGRHPRHPLKRRSRNAPFMAHPSIKDRQWPPKLTPTKLAMPRDNQRVVIPVSLEQADCEAVAVLRAKRIIGAHGLTAARRDDTKVRKLSFGWNVELRVRRLRFGEEPEIPGTAELAIAAREAARDLYLRAARLLNAAVPLLERAEELREHAESIEATLGAEA